MAMTLTMSSIWRQSWTFRDELALEMVSERDTLEEDHSGERGREGEREAGRQGGREGSMEAGREGEVGEREREEAVPH